MIYNGIKYLTGALQFASRFFCRLAQRLSGHNRSKAIIKRNEWEVIASHVTEECRVELQEHQSGSRWQIEVFERQWINGRCRNVPFCKTSYDDYRNAAAAFYREGDE